MNPPQHVHLSDSSSPDPEPRRRRVIVADIGCLLCGRRVGAILTDQWPPAGAVVSFQAEAARTTRPLAAWWRLRCAICGGNTAVTELTQRTVRLEPQVDWRSDRPRRGRPPKRLLAERILTDPDAA